jgi:hypothetical protein
MQKRDRQASEHQPNLRPTFPGTLVLKYFPFLEVTRRSPCGQAHHAPDFKGFKDFRCARIILSGVEFTLMIRKGKMRDDGARQFYGLAVLAAE